jgi:mono/diheme cytochrome c family protein
VSRRLTVPLAAGLAAAALAFVLVLALTGGSEASPRAPAPAVATPTRGRLVFAAMGCGSCHTLKAAGSRGTIGPSLDDALAHHTAASLKAKITHPGTGTVMPQDFARRMDATELAALVSFLVAARGVR